MKDEIKENNETTIYDYKFVDIKDIKKQLQDKKIKEILDKAKEISNYGADGKQHTRMFNQFEAKILLDYITNLQNENMKYDQCLTELTDNYKDIQKELTYLQEENERLKDYLKIMEKGKDNNLNRFLDYKSRIDKAIPMLEELNVKLKDILKIGIDIKEITVIKNQLQGSDE